MQLDLFDRPKGPTTLYVFPLACRKGLVEATARELASKDYHAGRAFWSRHAALLRRELKAAGFTPSIIAEEIKRYSSAVGRQARFINEYQCARTEDAP
ncbi:MAG TPA: DUF6074 family protein [Pseudorhizobium sp.]|nr:DUF6074 family protein [Pseudorhizobium sp.]